MGKKLVVATIHGMRIDERDYSTRFIKMLTDQIAPEHDADDVEFVSIYWGDITKSRKSEYYKAATQSTKLDFLPIRKFIISALGDAAGYQKVDGDQNSTFSKIHQVVEDTLDINVDNSTPMIVIAHSLGGQIMANYIKEKQQVADTQQSDLQNMNTLVGMFTLGCNIPLFSFAESDPKPMPFPGSALNDALTHHAKWYNYFDKDDVLGYPLKVINEAYDAAVDKDIEVNVGHHLYSWNPMSHDVYWQERNLAEPIGQFINQTLDIIKQ